MEKELVSYDQAVALKELGIILDNNIGGFYAKLNSKMFSIDEEGMYYRISNATKKIYIYGTHFVLNDKNVVDAPLKQQIFRWFREINIHGFVIYSRSPNMSGNQYYYTYLNRIGWNNSKPYKTYEEAESACIDRLIEIVKQQHGN